MRDFKFRAWVGGEMYQDVGVIQLSHDKQYGLEGKTRQRPEMWSFRPNEAEIMQYTGLKDKNGKEIYEGDILLTTDWGQKERWWGVVTWIMQGFVVSYHKPTNKTWTELTSLAEPENLDNWEVIGNIYENKELLK